MNLPVKPSVPEYVRNRARPFRMAEIDDLQLALAEMADELAEQEDVYALAQGLRDLRELNQKLKDLERHIEDHLADTMRANTHILDDGNGGLTLVRRGGHRWTEWEDEAVIRRLLADKPFDVGDMSTVVITPKTAAIVAEQLLLAMRPSWRTTVLRNHGIDPENYAQHHKARRTVQVYGTNQEPSEDSDD